MGWLIVFAVLFALVALGSRVARSREYAATSLGIEQLEKQSHTQARLARGYLDTVEPIKQLKRDGRLEEALDLCHRAMDATEHEAELTGMGVAPWYYYQAAVICRKLRRPDEELAVLRRFRLQPHAPGARAPKLLDRLRKLEERHSD